MRIYRIPLLPLKVILNNMKKVEILSFSFCSKRAHRVLKVCGKKEISYFNLTRDDIQRTSALNKLELFLLEVGRTDKNVLKEKETKLRIHLDHELLLAVDIENSIKLYIHSDYMSNVYGRTEPKKKMMLNGYSKPVVAAPNSVFYTFWDNKDFGLLTLVDYFNKNFNCIIDLHINADYGVSRDFQTSFQKISQYLVQGNVMIGDASVNFNGASLDDDYRYLLKNLKVTRTFGIHGMPSKNFKFNEIIQASTLEISNSPWFTFRYLSYGNFKNVDMRSMNFTYVAFKEFMKNWMEGRFPRLEKLKFGMNTKIDQSVLPVVWTETWDDTYEYEGVIAGHYVTATIEWNDWTKHVELEVDHHHSFRQYRENNYNDYVHYEDEEQENPMDHKDAVVENDAESDYESDE